MTAQSQTKEAGLGRQSLYKAVSPGAKPRYDNILKVLHSLARRENLRVGREVRIGHLTLKAEYTMKTKSVEGQDNFPDDAEPDWVDPASDRKIPYTEEELDLLVEGFIAGLSDTDVFKRKVAAEGIVEVKKLLKERLRQLDENNLVNLEPEGLIH
jgi:hypothetical protein